MKWIKLENRLVNLGHVSMISIIELKEKSKPFRVAFWDYDDSSLIKLCYKTEEEAEKHLNAISMFLENTHTTIMAMAPTLED